MSIPTSLHAARELIRVKASGSEFVELVHAATNQDPWGPTGPQMDDVCRAFLRGSVEIMEELKLRLKNRDKSWRSCYKSLLLLDHLARNVPEMGLPAVCSVAPTVRLISQTFYYTGRKGVDHGLSVRERAKKLCDLLSDGALLREEREKAAVTRSKLSCAFGGDSGTGGYAPSRYQGISSTFSQHVQPTTMCESTAYSTSRREEQERYDMELAARLQREEESRAGISVIDAEKMFKKQVGRGTANTTLAAQNPDVELAFRLEKEEEQRRSVHCDTSAPSVSKSTVAAAQLVTPESPLKPEPAHPQPEPAKTNILDDLFSTNDVTNDQSFHQLCSTTSELTQPQPSAPADPFDDFLNARILFHTQQQQQQQQPPQQQQQQQPPQQQYFGTTAGVGWGAVPQVSPQNPAVEVKGSGWFGEPVVHSTYEGMFQWNAQEMPPPTSNTQTVGLMQQAGSVAGGGPFTEGCPSSNDAGGGSTSLGNMEQQISLFAGQLSAQNQQPAKSLDAIMAERRTSW